MNEEEEVEECGASELGTQEYWQKYYAGEIASFKNHGDAGHVWFGEEIVILIMNWIKSQNISKDAKIVDLGCGNGMFLVELFNEGYKNLYGVDYSESAIELARNVLEKLDIKADLSVCNILDGLNGKFDIIHDKGTYDAISLSENAKEMRQKYIESVFNALENDGLFIVTACNWVQEELDVHFQEKFIKYEVIPTPTFKFGGKVGNLVTSCVYKKKI